MSDLVVVEVTGATVVVQEASPAEIVEVVAQGPQGGRGADGAQGPKGDTGDVTPAATAAKVAAEAAATSATASATSATSSATSAASSATSATNSANSASGSATQAANSATSASGSASTATTKASEASTSATNAASSASTATTKASEASTSASNAATSATSASNSASAASTSATSASASATTATTKAGEAATSATNAAASASTATTKASEASTSASNAATSASSASTSASNASTSATNAASSASSASTSATSASGSATTATTQAGIATTKASEAATSATNAATSASTASTKAGEAATSATAAATAKVGAEAARDSALAAYANFNDQYLGSKASDPTTDNTGGPLAAGNLYYNTAALNSGGGMKVYDGTVWLAAYASLSGALLSANNLSDIGSASSARTNLGLGNVENKSSATIRGEISSSNVTTALGFTPANAASLATVATTGSYADLIGKPTLFSGAYADLTGKPTLFSGAYADLTGKPTLFSGAYADLTGKPTAVSTFTNDAGYLTGITSTQINTALGYTAQAALVSGTNIKTVNSQSILGSGNIQIDGGVTSFNTRTGAITLTSGDVTGALTYTPLNVVGTPTSGQAVVWDSGSSTWVPGTAASKVTRTATAPSSPTVGDRWVHDTTGVEYLYLNDGDSNQWVELGPSPVLASLVTSVAGRTGAVTLSASDVSGLATVATSGSYNDLSNKPTILSTGKAIAMALVFGG